MALRLGEFVFGGEIYNDSKNSVHGVLGLRGIERPLVLNLTGNCDPDLRGRCFRFEVRGAQNADGQDGDVQNGDVQNGDVQNGDSQTAEEEDAAIARLGLPKLAWMQVGPTGDFTAARRVRVSDCPPIELLKRCQLGEPPPMTWKPCLYLEWYGQNGRVVVEIADPIIEFIPSTRRKADTGRLAAGDPPGVVPSPQPGLDEEDRTPSIADGDDAADWCDQDVFSLAPDPDPDEAPDPYGLFPDALQRQFDEQAREVERALRDADEPEIIRELRLMDELIERGGGEPLGALFDGALQLPRPDQLDERQAEQALKILLARLALCGVALDVCEHFTMHQAYRLLVEELCSEETAFTELRGTQWVQHFSTHEFCAECQAEFESD